MEAIRFCSILAHLFGESLDRTTLWERIGSALSSSSAKLGDDDDLDRFASLCLEHVRAEDSKAAACKPLLDSLEAWSSRTPAWRSGFLRYVKNNRVACLVRARARWERVKSGEVDL